MTFAKLAFGLALAAMTATGAVAAASVTGTPPPASKAATSDCQCIAQIHFPAGKEELSLADIRHAIRQHLIRVGMDSARLTLRRTADETVTATIQGPDAGAHYELVIDPAIAQILDVRAGQDATAAGVSRRMDYNARLRRHIMGDGQAWGNWVGRYDARLLCGDDYRPRAPEIPDRAS